MSRLTTIIVSQTERVLLVAGLSMATIKLMDYIIRTF